VKPFKVLEMHRPSWALGRIQEVTIRGLFGKQLEEIVDRVTPFVKNGGRIGTTSSHYSLTDDGRLARVDDEEVAWKNIALKEKGTLLEQIQVVTRPRDHKMRRAKVFERKA